MKITIEIPEEFVEHYNRDNFADSLKRIEADLKHLKYHGLSGRYELELIEILRNAFDKRKQNDR